MAVSVPRLNHKNSRHIHPQRLPVKFVRQTCEQTHNKTVYRGPWHTTRSQKWSTEQPPPELEAPLGGRQRPLPSISLSALSLAGPLLIPATNNPACLHRMTWSQGHRRCRTCPQAEVPLPPQGRPCLCPPSRLTCAYHGAAGAPEEHLASFGRSHGSEEDEGVLPTGLPPDL